MSKDDERSLYSSSSLDRDVSLDSTIPVSTVVSNSQSNVSEHADPPAKSVMINLGSASPTGMQQSPVTTGQPPHPTFDNADPLEDDYYFYDYSELTEHEEQEETKYEASLLELQTVGRSRSMTNFLDVDVLLGKDLITDADLFIGNVKPWNPTDKFIQNVATKVYLLIPAFAVGMLLGLAIWGALLMLFKTWVKLRKWIAGGDGNAPCKIQGNELQRDNFSLGQRANEEFFQIPVVPKASSTWSHCMAGGKRTGRRTRTGAPSGTDFVAMELEKTLASDLKLATSTTMTPRSSLTSSPLNTSARLETWSDTGQRSGHGSSPPSSSKTARAKSGSGNLEVKPKASTVLNAVDKLSNSVEDAMKKSSSLCSVGQGTANIR